LQSGDTIYVDGSERAVMRREGNRQTMYWLDGNLDLRRTELKAVAPNKYQVLSEIRGEGALRREFTSATAVDARPRDESRVERATGSFHIPPRSVVVYVVAGPSAQEE
jgi:hypothetical protein